jgi:hypothetical protein
MIKMFSIVGQSCESIYVEIIIIIIVDAILKLFKYSIMTKFLSLKVLSSKLHIETLSQQLNLENQLMTLKGRFIKWIKRH